MCKFELGRQGKMHFFIFFNSDNQFYWPNQVAFDHSSINSFRLELLNSSAMGVTPLNFFTYLQSLSLEACVELTANTVSSKELPFVFGLDMWQPHPTTTLTRVIHFWYFIFLWRRQKKKKKCWQTCIFESWWTKPCLSCPDCTMWNSNRWDMPYKTRRLYDLKQENCHCSIQEFISINNQIVLVWPQ